MHQISSPREQVGVNQHGPLRFGREEILMWLPQGSEKADPWRSSLDEGLESVEEVGAATFWPSWGGMAEESLGCLMCLSLPTSGVPAPQHREPAGGSCVALQGLLQGSVPWQAEKRHWGNIKFFHFDPSSPWDWQDLTLQFSNPLLYPYLGKNSIFIVAFSSLHQWYLSVCYVLESVAVMTIFTLQNYRKEVFFFP